MIQYSVHPTGFKTEQRQYHGKIKSLGHVTQKNIIDEMLVRGSTVTEADTAAVLILYKQVFIDYLKQGHTVNLDGVGAISLSLKGTFDSHNERFDKRKHHFDVNIKPSKKLKKLINTNIKTKMLPANLPHPNPVALKDGSTSTTNRQITSESVCSISGKLLKFDETKEDQGVFIINIENQEATRVTTYLHNTQSSITFKVPTLTASNVIVQVRSRMNQNVKVLRKNSIPCTLEVIK